MWFRKRQKIKEIDILFLSCTYLENRQKHERNHNQIWHFPPVPVHWIWKWYTTYIWWWWGGGGCSIIGRHTISSGLNMRPYQGFMMSNTLTRLEKIWPGHLNDVNVFDPNLPSHLSVAAEYKKNTSKRRNFSPINRSTGYLHIDIVRYQLRVTLWSFRRVSMQIT